MLRHIILTRLSKDMVGEEDNVRPIILSRLSKNVIGG